MRLKEEFVASFLSYVDTEGDRRRQMLVPMLEIPLGRLIAQRMCEPHDMAALLTCAVAVDPYAMQIRRLLVEVERWQQARQDAEDNYDDPDTIAFDPRVDDVPFQFDKKVEGLTAFFQTFETVENGNRYLAQVLACLVWARKIPAMVPNLWNPKE